MKTIITIDGGVATGGSTLAKNLGLALELPRIDSGSMYRAITYYVLQQGIGPYDEAACVKVAESARFDMPEGEVMSMNDQIVVEFVDGQRIDRLHVAEVDQLVPKVAGYRGVREAVNAGQRRFAAGRGAVADGRDCGLAVFPEADLKLFLVVEPEEAVRRRSDADGRKVSVQEILDRNEADRQHKHGPLAKAPDAVEIDTTNIDAGEMVQLVVELLAQPANKRPTAIKRPVEAGQIERSYEH